MQQIRGKAKARMEELYWLMYVHDSRPQRLPLYQSVQATATAGRSPPSPASGALATGKPGIDRQQGKVFSHSARPDCRLWLGGQASLTAANLRRGLADAPRLECRLAGRWLKQAK